MPFFRKPSETKGFSAKFRVEVSGFDELLEDMARFGDEGLVAIRDTMTESPGLLKDTLRVYAPRTKSLKGGKNINCGVVIGGKALEKALGKRAYSAWAIVQHEDLTLKHKRGQAKFLERPGNQVAARVPDALQAALDNLAEKHGAR
jgi:hypothetical protein